MWIMWFFEYPYRTPFGYSWKALSYNKFQKAAEIVSNLPNWPSRKNEYGFLPIDNGYKGNHEFRFAMTFIS